MGARYSRSRGTVEYTGGPGPAAAADAPPPPRRPDARDGSPPMMPGPSPIPNLSAPGGDRRGGTAGLDGTRGVIAPPDARHRFGVPRGADARP